MELAEQVMLQVNANEIAWHETHPKTAMQLNRTNTAANMACCGRTRSRKAVRLRIIRHATVPIMLYLQLFLLTFAQGQGHGSSGPAPVDERVSFTVKEGVAIGTLVGTIPTRQGLKYKFSEEPPEFHLDADNGRITTKSEVDREKLKDDSIDLFITSVPSARHLIEVRITVLDINDNHPLFSQPSIKLSFSETDQPGSQVILDTATDKDSSKNGVTNEYHIISGNEEGKFRLVLLTETSKPVLYLENTVELDREEKAFYQLNISSQDGGSPVKYGYLEVNITIEDFNDNPPLFDQSDYSTTVNETAPMGTSLIQVQATDRDKGANSDITYSIVNDDHDQFTVDPKTGVISILKKLFCERTCLAGDPNCKPKSCVVTVEASDNGRPYPLKGRAYVTVSLMDENTHNPVITFRYIPEGTPYATVDEGAKINSVVVIVTVTDLDDGLNGKTTFSITKGNELGHFKMDPPTIIGTAAYGFVKVAGQLDREKIPKYNLTLEAKDLGAPTRSSTAFLIVMVNDINDHEPIFQYPSYSAQLSELVPIGSFVAGITATDNDTGINAQITYNILSGNDLEWFKIDNNTGLVTTQNELDRESRSTIVLKISATDGGTNPYVSFTNLTVTIWDENDEVPTFSKDSYFATFQEEVPVATSIVTVTAQDNDMGKNGSIRYMLDPEVEELYPGMFQINQISGRISNVKTLDHEQFSRFEIKVKAVDQGSPSQQSSTTVYVNITDINDNYPIFYPVKYYASVLENKPAHTSIVQVKATDKDSGTNGQILYAFSSGADQKFVIDISTGWISTTQQLDREQKASYTLTVVARDIGSLQSKESAIVEITVNDVQDTPPVFSSAEGYAFTLPEDDGRSAPRLGRLVGQVSASARGARILYSITGGDKLGVFMVNSDTGVISTVKEIDRESQSSYSLSIVAVGGPVHAQTTVNVTVTDLNDNVPHYSSPTAEAYVVENWPVGHDIHLAKAADPDSGNNGKVTYTLTADSSKYFAVDKDTGMVKLGEALSQVSEKQFSVTVVAVDAGTPRLSSRQSVSIILRDVNDHTPTFQQAAYEVSISESRPVNDRFFQVTATDADTGMNGEVTYQILRGNHNERFGIFPDGVLYVAHPLDREDRDLYVLTVKASDKGVEARSSMANVTVHIMDANDNKPQFTNATYIFSLLENSPIGTSIGIVMATDLDMGRNSELSYRLMDDQEGFGINSKTGVLTSMQVYDRENMIDTQMVDFVSFAVIVQDNGESRLQDTATVKVFIVDTNDNAPEFTQKTYDASLYENAEIDTQVVRVSASDRDTGDNAKLTYMILSGNDGSKFRIDELSGQIELLAPLDRELLNEYVLVVMAMDSGIPAGNATAEVRISVLDNNDNAPRFIQSETIFSIIETAPPGEFICEVQALDPDFANNAFVSYQITAGNVGTMFHIDSNSGKLYLAAGLDYEQKSQYTVTVSASDAGVPSMSADLQLTINILDYNDNAPEFPASSISRQIREGVAIGTSVVTIQATDPDSGINGQLKYSIKGQEPEGRHFIINADTGVISVQQNIDHEYSDNFKLVIVATDQALPVAARKSSQKLVTIVVGDINDNSPVFVSMNAVPVLLGAQPNTVITQIQAVDLDSGLYGQVEYSLFDGQDEVFRIDRDNGDLYLRTSLNPLVMTHTLTIQAVDKGGDDSLGQKSTFFQLTVFARAAQENGPTFSQTSYSGQVDENSPPDTNIVTVKATGSSPTSNIEYFITNITSKSTLQNRYFQINPSTGLISNTEALDREKGYDIFNIEVYAMDKSSTSPKTRSTMVQITLLDKNDSPPTFIPASYDLEVAEDVAIGYVLTTVVATDADQSGEVRYRIKDGADGRFNVDPVTGDLTVAKTLDRETKSHYLVHVTADDGVQASEAQVNIEITDVNDERPEFSRPWYSFLISEDTQTGTRVGQITASDGDLDNNADLTYSIVSHWGKDKFSLHPHTGIFTLVGSLDYEQIHHYILSVKAQDSGSTPLSSTVSVYMNIVDENDNAPTFDPSTYSDEVWENATVGTSIMSVSATDMDSGVNGDVVYSIIGGDVHNQFSIESSTGVILVARPLDREAQAYYSLAIRAVDQALNPSHRLSSTALVSVLLKDANDNAPVFTSPLEISVQENTAPGTAVFDFQAQDADEGRNAILDYRLTGGDTDVFTLGAVDGMLVVRRRLDREVQDTYTLVVVVADKGLPPRSTEVTLTVHVADVNDETPTFDPKSYSTTVAEDIRVGTSLLTLFALDNDLGLNAEIRYLTISGDDNQDFYVNSHTGEVYVQKSLDYERKQEYQVVIAAQDLGEPPRSDTATVTITVDDVNDCAPVFVDSPYTAYVQEHVTNLPVHVLQLTARDDDSQSYASLSYSIQQGDQSLFQINRTTGEITALQSLDREHEAEYDLVVIAHDSGAPRLTGSGTVKILVGDINDNPPTFYHSHYDGRVAENQPAPASVVQLRATDADDKLNAEIRYSLVSDGVGQFSIHPVTGLISTRSMLDREQTNVYNLVAMATDLGTIPMSSTVPVTVTIEDANDNNPQFIKRSYTKTIQNPTPTGWFVLGVTALDKDEGPNGQITYSMFGSSDVNYFRMDENTGVITARSRLAGQSGGFRFNVRATDQGQNPLSDEVSVEISFLPEGTTGFPVFSQIQQSFRVSELERVGHTITTVRATSPKAGQIITYHVAGGNSHNALEISSGGQVILRSMLDYEKVKGFNLWIEARDGSNPSLSSYAQLNINVEDRNDNLPIFDKLYYNTTINEEEFPPLSVTTVTAKDLDSGENGRVTYQILDGNVGGAFEMDSSSGRIRTETKLDREYLDSYKLVVVAVDHGSPKNTATATVDISVLDKNDHPPVFTQHFYTRILENTPVGSFVIKITSTDADVASGHSYSLTSNPGGKFAIDRQSGNVTVAGYLDRETKDEYILRVAANDGAYNAETQLSIDILDGNDNPPRFSKRSYSFNTVENLPIGSSVGVMATSDMDAPGPNSEVYYRFKTPTSQFRVDPKTGVITTREVLEFKMAGALPSSENTVKLVMLAIDHGEPPQDTEVPVTIIIRPANAHAPVFQKASYFAPVAEDALSGLSILQVAAHDEKDSGENAEVEYTITGGNGTSVVQINPVSGWLILVRAPSDGLPVRDYTVQVTASDKGQVPRTATVEVHVHVSEINYYSPVFQGSQASFRASAAEDKAIGSILGRVTASDRDDGRNGQVSYYLTGGDPEGIFSVDESNGYLRLAKALDYENQKSHDLDITARDRGYLPREVTRVFVVSVGDVNDNPPQFPSDVYEAYIAENSPSGTFVLDMNGTDADTSPNSAMEYYVIGSGPAMDKFNIQRDTGVLRSQGMLDYERTSEYDVTVKVVNPGTSLSGTTMVKVHVVSVNEFLPKFTYPEYQFTVSESTLPGYSVGSVSATDEDSGPEGQVYYYLLADSNMRGFTIDHRTGAVIISDSVDREATSEIVLDVIAVNSGPVTGNDTARCRVRVAVRDANDAPRFTQSLYETRLREHIATGVSVLKVSAVDNDIQPADNRFTYTILEGNDQNTFRLDPSTGWLYTNGDLDRETAPVHTLRVGAVDSGIPPLTGTTVVRVRLDDINDNGPYFEPEVPVGELEENRQAYTDIIIDLKEHTKDPDLPPYQGPYTYRLVDNTDSFEVNPASGLVKSKVVLNRETSPQYKVKVEVKDAGIPAMSSTLTFMVKVTDDNDNPSSERDLKVDVYAFDGKFAGGMIADIRPSDPDSSGDYACSLLSGDSDKFSLPEACHLHVSPTQELGTYQLRVTGSDGLHNSVSYGVTVEFKSYNQQTVDNSIVVRLSQNTASGFLKDSYASFVSAVDGQLKDGGSVMVYAISQDESLQTVNLFLAIHYSQRYYLAPTQTAQKIKDMESAIESAANVRISHIHYNPCRGSPCLNGATCTSKISLAQDDGAQTWIVDSPRLILRGGTVKLAQVCLCPDGVTGQRCEETINKCDTNPCENGGSCVSDGAQTRCVCTAAWSGSTCSEDVNECLFTPCKNAAICTNSQGAYQCDCVGAYTGKHCEVATDFCEQSPCQNGGSCLTNGNGPYCKCQYGFSGTRCEIQSKGFSTLSYLEYSMVLSGLRNLFSVEFATVKSNALLMYYPGESQEFLSLEVVGGRLRFSFGLRDGQPTTVTLNKKVDDGLWRHLEVERTGKVATLKVTECPEDSNICNSCQDGDTSCYARVEAPKNGTFSPNNNQLLIGGIKSVESLDFATGEISSHDFVGCMRAFRVDDKDIFSIEPVSSNRTTNTCTRTPQCQPGVCKNGGKCMDQWTSFRCKCPKGFAGEQCEVESNGFGLGPNTVVVYKQREDYLRDKQMNSVGRRKRAVPGQTRVVSLKFKTKNTDGLLLYSKDTGTQKYSAIMIEAGQAKYRSGVGIGEEIVISVDTDVTDSEWHNVTVTVEGAVVRLSVDGAVKEGSSRLGSHDPVGPEVNSLELGGSLQTLTFSGKEIPGFEGCLDGFLVDGESLPLDGSTDQFTIRQVGEVATSCEGFLATPGGAAGVPVAVVVSVIVVFFILVLAAILVTFFVLRWRRRKAGKNPNPDGQPKQNGTLKSNAAMLDKMEGREHQDSGYTDDGNLSEEHIIGEHIASELGNRRYNEREIRGGHGFPGARPDVIAPESAISMVPDGVDNTGYEDQPEHYDIDNASSIAPSDLVDVVSHYNRYRKANGMVNPPGGKYKNKRGTPSPSDLLDSNRLSPHHLRASPNPIIGMQNSALVHAPNNLNRPPNHLPRQSPMPNIPPPDKLNSPMAPSSLRSTPLSGITGLYSGNASNSSGGYDRPTMANGHINQPQRPGSHLRQPVNPARGSTPKGLTVEEVNRLNARNKADLATVGANSVSSEEPIQNNINRTDFTHADLLDPASHLPPESSSDESTNDSFTCSEFEQDNDKMRRDFVNPHRLAVPRLAKVDENDTDTSAKKRYDTPDKLDSNKHDSISTFFTSDEDMPKGPSQGGMFPSALNWDYLLNWGPNFEKLVGVFSDIAQLPDNGPKPQAKGPSSGRNSAQSPTRRDMRSPHAPSPRHNVAPSPHHGMAPSPIYEVDLAPTRGSIQSPALHSQYESSLQAPTRNQSPTKHAQSPRTFSDSSSITSSHDPSTRDRPPSRQKGRPQMGTKGAMSPQPYNGAYMGADRPPSRTQAGSDRPPSRSQLGSDRPPSRPLAGTDRPPSRTQTAMSPTLYNSNQRPTHYGERPPSRVKSPAAYQNNYSSDGNSPRSQSSDSPNVSHSSYSSHGHHDNVLDRPPSDHYSHQEAFSSLSNGHQGAVTGLSPTKNMLAPLNVISEGGYHNDSGQHQNGIQNSFESLPEEYV